MPANQQQYIVPTGVLFYILNINRKTKQLASVEEALIARKLGILFTFKTNHYINFKEEIILLVLISPLTAQYRATLSVL